MIAALAFVAFPMSARAQVSVGISIGTAPPPIPVYYVPGPPGPNYVWEPGYWAWGPGGYYWVPGTWVYAPQYGLYWTPGYWNWTGFGFAFVSGYWGPQVGYYGGVNYGGGYYGNGYGGGYWRQNAFVYNTSVYNVNRSVVRGNVYSHSYPRPTYRTSYVGGRGGLQTRPTPQQAAYMHAHHYPPTSVQVQHAQVASQNRAYYARVNGGRPPAAAVARPYTAATRPANFRPLTPQDRTAAQATVRGHAAPAMQQHAAPMHAAPMQHAAPMHAAPVQHAAPMHAAPMHAAPMQHAAPMHAAPMQHAAPMHAAPMQHAAPMHAAPMQHAAPQKAAPNDKKDQH